MRISDWSSDVCSSDLDPAAQRYLDQGRTLGARGQDRLREVFPDEDEIRQHRAGVREIRAQTAGHHAHALSPPPRCKKENRNESCSRNLRLRRHDDPGQSRDGSFRLALVQPARSAEHTSELQSLMRIYYAGI